MIREYHVRFCEGLGVKSPRSTRRSGSIKLVALAVLCVTLTEYSGLRIAQ